MTIPSRLRIAQLAPLWCPVPPRSYGGRERVVHLLTEELVQRGHDVTLIASGDSRTAGRLEAVLPRCLIDAMADGRADAERHYELQAVACALAPQRDFDVVHSHLGAAFVSLTDLAACPVVHSLPHAITVDDRWVLRRHPAARACFVSEAQRRQAPDLPNSRVVYNACDFSAFPPVAASGDYLTFLGRMSPHKGPTTAIRLARRLGWPIVLAGEPMTAAERRYFTAEVEPLIDQDRVRHVGAVDDSQKAALLGGAAALIFPIAWEEPFGIVMVESMACGTPVVALSRGSVPEVIDQGITGFFTADPRGLPDLVEQACGLDRRQVRAHAEQRFGLAAMVDAYEAVYRDAVGAGRCG
ncbi:MAG TPA: glycosyltransferase family 4 protein [Nitriliruptorales bacterium]|nr:glycosyltransferase family 4 protein [Nitriliruptorales bacterium]